MPSRVREPKKKPAQFMRGGGGLGFGFYRKPTLNALFGSGNGGGGLGFGFYQKNILNALFGSGNGGWGGWLGLWA